jgi:hypothetical protein
MGQTKGTGQSLFSLRWFFKVFNGFSEPFFKELDPDQFHIGMTVFCYFTSSWRASGQDLVFWCFQERDPVQVP